MYFDFCEVAPLMTNCYLIGDETVCPWWIPADPPSGCWPWWKRAACSP